MPTLRRSVSLSSFGSFTSCPSTVIEPPSIGVSALMQRMKVDLPEPEGPMTQTTSPFISSSEMPFSTWRLPNDLCTSRQRMIGWSGVQVGEEVMGEVSCQTAFWLSRSEEGRVGKEGASTCRSRWWPDHEQKKNNRQ